MDSLGLLPGDVVHVLFSNFSGLVIAVKGSRLAVSRRLASYLTVRNFQDNAGAQDD
jgi:Fe2+ transport system protein FeoA